MVRQLARLVPLSGDVQFWGDSTNAPGSRFNRNVARIIQLFSLHFASPFICQTRSCIPLSCRFYKLALYFSYIPVTRLDVLYTHRDKTDPHKGSDRVCIIFFVTFNSTDDGSTSFVLIVVMSKNKVYWVMRFSVVLLSHYEIWRAIKNKQPKIASTNLIERRVGLRQVFWAFIICLTLSGAHFSVKLILAINGNLGVFGVADHDSGIRIANLKMADPRWRLCDSNVEFFEQFAQNTLYGSFWSCRLQIWCQDCQIQNSGYKMATILLSFWSFRTIDTKLAVWIFFGSLITILKSELENSKSGVRIAKFEMADPKWRLY